MARPEKPIDWAKVDQLLMAGCTGTEICPHFDMTPDTFYIRVKEKYNLGFQEYCCIKRQQGDSLLRAKQYEKALKGDGTMLIWLGKNRLKQREEEFKQQPTQMVVNADLAAGASADIPAKAISEENNTSS